MDQRSNCSKRGRLDMDPLSEDSEPPSSSDSGDTVEDETYEIDPTDLQSDEEKIEYATRAKEKGKTVLREEDNEAESEHGDIDNVLEEEIDFSDEEDAGSESGDSVECGDHIREELQHDTEELIVNREMNRNLRRVQRTSIGPVTTNQVFKQDDEAGMVLPPNIERRGLGRRNTDRRSDVNECSIKTSSSKIKHDNPPRKESRSGDSESSTMKRAEEVLAKLSTKHPCFIKCIIHSHTRRNGWLSIPAKFCHKHLPKCNANLELVDEHGKTFRVNYLGNKRVLTAGWNDFSSEHKLDKGDFLVGQLVNKASFQVEIHIIRHNVLAETDGDLGLLESDTYVTISNDGEKNGKAFAKGQEKHLERLSSCSPSNILEDPDYMPPGLCTYEVLKCSSAKMHLRSSKYAQQSRESNHPDPSSLQSTSMISDPVLQATDTRSAPVPHQVAEMSSDPVSLQATIDKTPKHRSCKVKRRTCQEATRNQPEQIENEYGIADFHFSRSRKRRRAYPAPLQSTNMSSDPGLLRGIEMCSVQFGDHLERIWMSFPTDKLVDFTYLECLWFMMHRETCHRTLVLSWIKKKDIFSRKYIFVPICIWGHWNLLILCHFGESLASESKKPFMLLLDSLHKAEPMRYGPEIRKFVMDIFKKEEVSYRSVSKIRLLVPKVPQQKNKECGYFTLYYIKKFIEANLETISDDDLDFMNENWFSQEELDGFCVALHEESKAQELLHSQDMALNESSTDGDVICLD